MKVHCNAEVCVTNLVGDLPGYGPAWYDSNAIANILSLKVVQEKYHIMYISEEECGFVVTKSNEEIFKFQESENGLHYLDTDKVKNNNTNEENIFVVNTVTKNQANIMKNDYQLALRARGQQIPIG